MPAAHGVMSERPSAGTAASRPSRLNGEPSRPTAAPRTPSAGRASATARSVSPANPPPHAAKRQPRNRLAPRPEVVSRPVTQDAYTAAGVSQAHADSAVAALVSHLSKIETGKPSRVVPLPGHYASVLRIDEHNGIAFGTDGVGTKMVVAEQMDRYDTIGIDCIAMNVNDLVCVGAEPIALVDFILCRTANPEICGAIGQGLRRGAELSGIEIPGGEIAQVGDVVSGHRARRQRDRARRARRDRRRLRRTRRRRDHRPPQFRPALQRLHARPQGARRPAARPGPRGRLGRPLGDVLLEPTEIYVETILELLAVPDISVNGLAHITGDGLNNLLRLGDGRSATRSRRRFRSRPSST